eukprot:4298550-Amphidinium_carterae.2
MSSKPLLAKFFRFPYFVELLEVRIKVRLHRMLTLGGVHGVILVAVPHVAHHQWLTGCGCQWQQVRSWLLLGLDACEVYSCVDYMA